MVKWDEIKIAWESGTGNLRDIAETNGVTIPEIMLHAKTERWGVRASKPEITDENYPQDHDEVMESYRRTMFNIKGISDKVIEELSMESNQQKVLDTLDTISKVIGRILPLSFQVSDFKGLNSIEDKKIKELIKEEQIKALKKGDVKMLMFLGKQYLGQSDKMDITGGREISSKMTPKEASNLYQQIMKGQDE